MKKKNRRRVIRFFKKLFQITKSSVGVIGIILASIAVIPVIKDFIEKPKIYFVRQAVHISDEIIITDFLVKNIGNSIANDIFIKMQTFKGDNVILPFAVAYEKKTNDSINWEILIKSLSPNESTNISVQSTEVERYASFAKELKENFRDVPQKNPKILSIDYREGRMVDVIREDAPELKEYVQSQLEKYYSEEN